MPSPAIDRLRGTKTLPQLLAYLRDELDWPIDSDDIDSLSFEYDASELGLDEKSAVKVKEIKQLRPLTGNQPWGIFFVNFEKKRLPVMVMRRVLRSLVFKKRTSPGKSDRQAWHANDLLFISAYGEEHDRAITFAHFVEDEELGGLAELRVLGWDDDDTPLKYDYVAYTLREKLRWRDEYERDSIEWRNNWRNAFELRHREVITTSKQLASCLANLAKKIRARVRSLLRYEDGFGQIRKLQTAFRKALIHDLSDDDFADMYAQTITYGLFSAAVSRPAGIHGENIVDMVPVTNPFLRDMLKTFLNLSGRKGKIDFDELGIQEVVALLNSPSTHLDAVLRDFGNRTQREDPVIHFYEDFLGEYDARKKIQRGVFYTPQPVVSYIVRSVHELLQTEFGLEDGLADTSTWREMAKKQVGLKIPEGVKPEQPFIQILDPATGTATFLVEVIDVIHRHLKAKWEKGGLKAMPVLPATSFPRLASALAEYWNQYVALALLPRLHGYELMMAPYAIAHMKIGLKLFETGYRFGSDERARVYLTNTLEAPQDFSDRLAFDAPALAHEAEAVNSIKRGQRFTVVIGNPPYSKISSNLTPEMRATVERYRYLDGDKIKERGALQFEINLQDDYVKFFRFGEEKIMASNVGILGLITNNGYLSTPTLRGMRDSLLETFRSTWALDLHGHLAKGEIGPDGAQEENVFDIVQGVSLFLGDRTLPKTSDSSVFHAERYGSRSEKYSFLQSNSRSSTIFSEIKPSAPFYLFVPHDADLAQEWKQDVGLTELFPKNSAGIITARDALVISESKRELGERLKRFSRARGAEKSIYDEFGFSESKRFDLREAQGELRRLKSFTEPIRRMLHRPFDERFIFYHGSVVWSLSRPMAEQMNNGKNLALVATRQVTRPQFEHAYVSRHIIEIKACSHDRNTQIFPLFIRGTDGELALSSDTNPNLNPAVLTKLAKALGLKLNNSTREVGKDEELSPLRLFHFAYAILHSESYRERYFEFLRSDFPRLPLTGNLELFRALARLGGELVALHLLESPKLDKSRTEFIGARNPEVEKISWSKNTVWIDKAQTTGFKGVPGAVWNFHIGGYHVCEKWLKDRKGRTLSKHDIVHYHKIVIALAETIRLMSEIDKVIEKHGGWPGAFASSKAE